MFSGIIQNLAYLGWFRWPCCSTSYGSWAAHRGNTSNILLSSISLNGVNSWLTDWLHMCLHHVDSFRQAIGDLWTLPLVCVVIWYSGYTYPNLMPLSDLIDFTVDAIVLENFLLVTRCAITTLRFWKQCDGMSTSQAIWSSTRIRCGVMLGHCPTTHPVFRLQCARVIS